MSQSGNKLRLCNVTGRGLAAGRGKRKIDPKSFDGKDLSAVLWLFGNNKGGFGA